MSEEEITIPESEEKDEESIETGDISSTGETGSIGETGNSGGIGETGSTGGTGEESIVPNNTTPQTIKIDINDESIVKFSDTDLFVDFSKITGLKPNTTYIMSIDNGAIISASGVAVAKFNPIVFTTGT